ncbi:hypothetical protein BD289DRAFT_243290 [Coniella lustricola]|uniref:Uncharacterized protein n=1 Tax=Coniella lustricola TaxID=2025994 RepID=A0A2T3A9G1_9PEZI|nr:hypothetical protein BD289DRAFT_243290 [Coniella lustricola]
MAERTIYDEALRQPPSPRHFASRPLSGQARDRADGQALWRVKKRQMSVHRELGSPLKLADGGRRWHPPSAVPGMLDPAATPYLRFCCDYGHGPCCRASAHARAYCICTEQEASSIGRWQSSLLRAALRKRAGRCGASVRSGRRQAVARTKDGSLRAAETLTWIAVCHLQA